MKKREIYRIFSAPSFEKSFQRLPQNIQQLFVNKEQWFKTNAFDPRLKTHPLHGKLDGLWAYSINQQYRVLFKFLKSDEVLYLDIGTHRVYK